MSWEPLGTSRATEGAAVTVSTSAGAGRLPCFLTFTLRQAVLPALGFMHAGGTCQVLFGRGEHAGRARIVPGEVSSFFATGRQGKKGGSLTVRVRMPAGVKAMKRPPEPLAFEHGEDWLELTLPEWGVAVERAAPPPPARTSIMDRVADPAASLRGVRR